MRRSEAFAEEPDGLPLDELLAMVLGAPRRHPRIAMAAFVATLSFSVGVALLRAPVYTAQVSLLAQPGNTVARVATNSHQEDSATAAVSEDIMKRENVLALVKEAQLVERWDIDRSRAGRLKDKILGPPSDAQKLRAMVGSVEKKLLVSTDGPVITIQAEWPADETVYRLVTLAEEGFLDARLKSDTSMIRDGIAILESYIQTDRDQVDQALAELDTAEKKQTAEALASPGSSSGAKTARPSAGAAPYRAPTTLSVPDPEVTRRVEEQRRELIAREEQRQQRLSLVKAQLADVRSTLAPAHPDVIALERKVAALSQPSDDSLAMLSLGATAPGSKAAHGGSGDASHGGLSSLVPGLDPGSGLGRRGDSDKNVIVVGPTDDAATLGAKAKIQDAITRYGDLRSSLRAAQVELDVARAAFKYKYSVITPAEVPEKAKGPNPPTIVALGILAALLLTFGAPALYDLSRAWFASVWRKSKLDGPAPSVVPPDQRFERTIYHVPWPPDANAQPPRLNVVVYEDPTDGDPPRLNR